MSRNWVNTVSGHLTGSLTSICIVFAACPQVRCGNPCPNGFATTPEGCPSCECLPLPPVPRSCQVRSPWVCLQGQIQGLGVGGANLRLGGSNSLGKRVTSTLRTVIVSLQCILRVQKAKGPRARPLFASERRKFVFSAASPCPVFAMCLNQKWKQCALSAK